MDLTKRIAQFENMCQADPSNEMAHFSLGKAYGESGRFEDAAASFMRCIQLVPDMSTAYQMAGDMLVKAGKLDRAGDVLTDGFTVASEKGDLKPKKAIEELLTQLKLPIPQVKKPAATAAAAAVDDSGPVPPGMMRCRKSSRIGNPMPRPPFKGALGEWIAANISKETFSAWISQGTKVINEIRLDLSKDKDQDTYDQHMREYLGIDDEVMAEISSKTNG